MKLSAVLGCSIFMFSACGQPPEKHAPIRLTRSERGYDATLQFVEARHLLIFSIAPERDSGGAELSIRDRIAIWKPLAEQFLREHGGAKEYLVAAGRYPELNSRIAFAAACSDAWDTKTGKPKAGEPAGTYIKHLITEGRLAREVQSFFESLGYELATDSVEGVTVCDWSRIRPDSNAQCHPNPGPKAAVPCGASILFRATAK